MKILNNKILTVIFSALAVFALSGCGSEGIPSSDELVGGTAPVSEIIVDAGQDKDVAAGHNVSLHGVAKMSDGNNSFEVWWTQAEGDVDVSLNDADTLNPTFVSPHVQVKTLLVFTLHVKSESFEKSDVVTIFVLPTTVPQVLPPSTPIVTHSGSTVTVHSGTLPPTSTQTLTHQWTQVSGPAVTLQTSHLLSTTFVAPDTTAGAAVVLQHVVTSTPTTGGAVTHKKTTHTVHVVPKDGPLNQISVTITPPATVYETLKTPLHASAAGGDGHYTYTWSQTSGVAVTLDQTDPQNPTFTSPKVDKNEDILLQLVVTDTDGHSITKHIHMTIKNVNLTIKASADPFPDGAHTIHLHVLPTSQPVLNLIKYTWSQVGGPIQVDNTDNPKITLPGDATYTFEVEAVDAAGNKSPAVQVKVTTRPPLHVKVGQDLVVPENAPVHLVSFSTGASGPVTFSWKQTGGQTVVLKDAGTKNPSFTSPFTNSELIEDMTFELTVIETVPGGTTRSATGTVRVTVKPLLPAVVIGAASSLPVSSDGGASCMASGGDGNFTFNWKINAPTDADLTPVIPLTVKPTYTESIVNIRTSSADKKASQLICSVTDGHGRTVTTLHAFSIVTPPPVSTLSVVAGEIKSITENQLAVFSSSPQGGTAPYTYEWIITPADKGTILDNTLANPTFRPKPVDTNGAVVEYYVIVTDSTGRRAESSRQHMRITDVPFTVSQVIAGTSHTISRNTFSLHVDPATGGSGGPYTYQWYLNGTAIQGKTTPNASLTAPHVDDIKTCNHGGHHCTLSMGAKSFTYRVEVTDTITGEVISRERQVSVYSR